MSISYRRDIEKRLGIIEEKYHKTLIESGTSFSLTLHIKEKVRNLYIPRTIVLPGDGEFRFKRYKSRV